MYRTTGHGKRYFIGRVESRWYAKTKSRILVNIGAPITLEDILDIKGLEFSGINNDQIEVYSDNKASLTLLSPPSDPNED